MKHLRIILLPAVAMVAGCSDAPVVSIANGSQTEVSNAVVSGSMFTNAVGTLRPSEERSIVVHPRGESSVRLTFEAGGRKYDSGDMDYFENSGMYRVSLTITSNLQVESSSTIKQY